MAIMSMQVLSMSFLNVLFQVGSTVLVHDKTQEEHNDRLYAVLQRLEQSGMTLNRCPHQSVGHSASVLLVTHLQPEACSGLVLLVHIF